MEDSIFRMKVLLKQSGRLNFRKKTSIFRLKNLTTQSEILDFRVDQTQDLIFRVDGLITERT